MAWAKTPLRFLFLGTIGGALFGYVLFKVIFGLPENMALIIGIVILCPVAVVWEIRWRQKSGYELDDGKVASLYGISTWIVTAGLAILGVIGLLMGVYK